MERPDNSVLEIDELKIREFEFFCILGASGCGKTTLLNLLSGVLPPTKGSVSIAGRTVSGPTPDCIQLFQEYGLFPWKTVYKNVQYGLELQHLSKAERNETTDKFLDIVGLTDAADLYPRELSGGMKQRVAIARALAVKPKVLLMDEPFGALDSITRLRLQKEMTSIWSKTKKTIVWVTHNIDEAIALGDRIAVMQPNPGRIKEIVEVNLPRPRFIQIDMVLKLKQKILELLEL